MKKRLIVLFSVLVLSLTLFSCGKEKLTDFEKLVQYIYASEETLAGYTESNIIYDGDFEVYNKTTDMKIQRGEKVKSEVYITEKKLSTSGTQNYDEVVTSYKTVDNVKYTVVNGITYENSYEMPTYYLTFVLSEDFLKSGYELSVNGGIYSLKADVIDNKISSLFLNKSLNSVTNLSIEIVVNNTKLQSFKANYTSTTGNTVVIETTYVYAEVGTGKAVFYLEGGYCQNSKDRVSYLYSFDGTMTETKIVDPNVLETEEKNMITKSNHHIEGWYKTKTTNSDGTVTYSDKWDFENDKMTIDGVVLYAKWDLNRVYTYELYYKNESGEDVLLDSYVASEGDPFYEKFMDVRTVDGYTSLGYLDEEGNPWDEDFTHPGGDNDLAIKIYLDLIEGEYTIVSKKSQLNTAIKNNKNIYLLNDIDYGGSTLSFDSYSGEFNGAGHKIYNFEIGYDTTKDGLMGSLDDLDGSIDHLYISLFFELKDATIKNLTFDEILIDVNTTFSLIKYLIVSPLATTATNVTLENVALSGNITYSKLPNAEITIILDDYWYQNSNCTVDEASSVLIAGGLPTENN